jgi:hypothetical protein
VNARLIPGPGDAPLPTIERTLANTLRDECDSLETVAEAISNLRSDVPIISDLRLDSRRRDLVDQLMQIESALFDLAEDVRGIVEDP